jgi:hypothetical protein
VFFYFTLISLWGGSQYLLYGCPYLHDYFHASLPFNFIFSEILINERPKCLSERILLRCFFSTLRTTAQDTSLKYVISHSRCNVPSDKQTNSN